MTIEINVISLPYIFQVLYVLCFTRPRYQVSVYRTIGSLVIIIIRVSPKNSNNNNNNNNYNGNIIIIIIIIMGKRYETNNR